MPDPQADPRPGTASPAVELVAGPFLTVVLGDATVDPEVGEARFVVLEVGRDGVPGRSHDGVRGDIASWHELGLPVIAWVTERLTPAQVPPFLGDVDLAAVTSRATTEVVRAALTERLGDAAPPVRFVPAGAPARACSPVAGTADDTVRLQRGATMTTLALAEPADDGRSAETLAATLHTLRARGGLTLVLDPEVDTARPAFTPTPADGPGGEEDADDASDTECPEAPSFDPDVVESVPSRGPGAAVPPHVVRAGNPLPPGLRRRRVLPGLRSTAAATTPARVLEHVRAAGAWADSSDSWAPGAWATLAAAGAGTPVAAPGGGTTPGDALPDALIDLVERVDDPPRLRGALVALAAQPELRDRVGHRLHRAVHAGETLEHRLTELAAAVGLSLPKPPGPASISCVVPTNRPHELDNVFASIGRQTHRDAELVLVLHGLELPEADLRARAADAGVEHLTIRPAPAASTLGHCMNLGVDAASGDLVAKMDDDNHYGEHYLHDLQLPFRYTDAGIVGKWAHYVWLRSTGAVVLRYPDAEHTFARRVQGGSMLFRGHVVRSLRFSDIPRAVDTDILDRAIAEGVGIYSADRYNYVSIRSTDRTSHTWTVEDSTFMTPAGTLAFYGDPREQVSI